MDDLKRYIGTKIIDAQGMTRGDYNKRRGWTIPGDENPDDPGFLVVYPDGYKSWSPLKQFLAAYRATIYLSFGMALEALRIGKKVARTGWNGHDMFVFLRLGREVTGVRKSSAMGGDFESLPHLCMRTSDGKCCVGWLASQTDMLSDDWYITE